MSHDRRVDKNGAEDVNRDREGPPNYRPEYDDAGSVEKNLSSSSMGDANFKILTDLRSVVTFRDSQFARLAFAVFCRSPRSADEGRNDSKCLEA